MRPSNKQRSRNKPGNNGSHINNSNQRRNIGNIINRVFESAGPDGKVRGTPQQIIDKYQALARDAQVSGDRVAAESYLQHSEHYSRMLGEAQRQTMENRSQGPDRDDASRERDDSGRGEDQPDFRPQPQPQQAQPASVAPGLTTFDTEDRDDFSGPVETPEGRRAPTEEPVPMPRRAPEPVDVANGRDHAPEDPAVEAPPEPAKRPRTRRRAKPETGPEAAAQAE